MFIFIGTETNLDFSDYKKFESLFTYYAQMIEQHFIIDQVIIIFLKFSILSINIRGRHVLNYPVHERT